MLQHCVSSHFNDFNIYQDSITNNNENLLLHSTERYHGGQSARYNQSLTNQGTPLQASLLGSNSYHTQLYEWSEPATKQTFQENNFDVDQSKQTLSAAELQALTTPTRQQVNESDEEEDSDDSTLIMNLSRRLRTNLTLAKQRMMLGLKQSGRPNDIAIYTQLEKITLDDPPSETTTPIQQLAPLPRTVISDVGKTVGNGRNLFPYDQYNQQKHSYCNKSAYIPSKTASSASTASLLSMNKNINKNYRVHKRKPYYGSSSYMELQTNPNGYVSVVLRKSNSSTKDSYATLARSFSFNMLDNESESESESDGDSDDMMSSVNTTTASITDTATATATTATATLPAGSDSNGDNNNADELCATFLSPWTCNSSTINAEDGDADMKSVRDILTPTWMEDLEYAWQQFDHTYDSGAANYALAVMGGQMSDENVIDTWLQRGGFGECQSLVAATDQELADLLQFD